MLSEFHKQKQNSNAENQKMKSRWFENVKVTEGGKDAHRVFLHSN